MKKFSFIKILMVLLLLCLMAGGGLLAWKKVLPVMADLKEKDAEKFSVMVAMAKSFDFADAAETFKQLDRMTYEEVITVRYRALKKKRREDEEFRKSQWENELEEREEASMEIMEKRQAQLVDLALLSQKKPGRARSVDWKNSGPWEKGLLLREKCIKFLGAEKSKNNSRKKIHQLSGMAPLLAKPKETSLTIPEICEAWVPISHEEAKVVLALETMQNKMDYFFFVQLLDEVGVSRQEVFSFSKQLDRMTGGFAGS